MSIPNITAAKRRAGKPFTIYLSEEQFSQLQQVAKQRRVAKSALVRYALERLILQMECSNSELPLGITE
jgi:predicted transcriptional regulator